MRRFLIALAAALAVGGASTTAASAAIFTADDSWGVINRNTIGAATAQLRDGPATATSPVPFGLGSVNLTVPSGADKVVWGNEVDFAGTPLANVQTLGFRVFQTGENAAVNALNLPNVALELDSNGGTLQPGEYTTLNGVVGAAAPVNQWSAVTHTQFWMTGGVGTATGCNQVTYCSLAAVKAALPNATILTIGINKGRDYAWQGAVDGLGINADIYDFELPRTEVPVPGPPQVIVIGGVATPVGLGAQSGVDTSCRGNTRRTIRASRRKGERFLSVSARLLGRSLNVDGRRITVDLRLRTQGDYNVRLTARYRKTSGGVRVVRSTRKLSVTCR